MHHLRIPGENSPAQHLPNQDDVPEQPARRGIHVRPRRSRPHPQGLHGHRLLPECRQGGALHREGQRGLPLPHQHAGGCEPGNDASVPALKSPAPHEGARRGMPVRRCAQRNHPADQRPDPARVQRHGAVHHALHGADGAWAGRPQGCTAPESD